MAKQSPKAPKASKAAPAQSATFPEIDLSKWASLFEQISKEVSVGLTLPSIGKPLPEKFKLAWHNFCTQLSNDQDLLAQLLRSTQSNQLEIVNRLSTEMLGDVFANSLAQLSGVDVAKQPQPVAFDPKKRDKRFGHALWDENGLFRFYRDSYLEQARFLNELVAKVDLNEDDKRAVEFLIGQYVSAISPSNNPAINPDIWQTAVESGGESIKQGMSNLLDDLQQGRISNVDRSAFTIGENVAITAGKVIHENPLCQLIEYAPTTSKVHEIPLLIVPPCINKYYILDLQPHNSFVKAAVDAGFRVFMVSWVNADPKVQNAGWDEYVDLGVLDSIDIVCKVAKTKKVNTLGFCIGGTLLGAAAAILADRGDKRIKSLTLLTALLDFSDTGDIGIFLDKTVVEDFERQIGEGGLMDGKQLAQLFATLRPNDLIWPYVISNYYQGKKPPAFDILFWNADSTHLPGPMYCDYIRNTYLDNKLLDSDWEVLESPVDMSLVNVPAYVVSCERDHIVPWVSAYNSARLLSGKIDFVLSSSGHVAGIVNPPIAESKGDKGKSKSKSKKGFRHNKSLNGRRMGTSPSKWVANSEEHLGSWWPHWHAWLKESSGKKVAAPKVRGNENYKPLMDAPGSYVKRPLYDIK